MCGIIGSLNDVVSNEALNSLKHRGPDMQSRWSDGNGKVSLGHTRLAIQDLSAAGNQPMTSNCGRYTIVFNGEIYNHLVLRKDMHFRDWKGSSDTETLIELISELGFLDTLTRLSGQFSFALWDSMENKLFLARDPFGEKPLYYTKNESKFSFSSEIKALILGKNKKPEINHAILNSYFKFGFIMAPQSIYKDIYKLEPGHYMMIDIDSNILKHEPYWKFTPPKDKAKHSTEKISFEAENLLKESIKEQLISDVPLGAFLSAGIDSSSIVTQMRSIDPNKEIRTFTISFEEDNFNEGVDARLIAEHLKTNHHELKVSFEDLVKALDLMPSIYGEPFADSSQIPTYILSSFAKKHITVALSGDGGDELFCGYNRHHFLMQYKNLLGIPYILRKLIAKFIKILPEKKWKTFFKFFGYERKYPNLASKIYKVADVLESKNDIEIYENLLSKLRYGEEPCTQKDQYTSNLIKKYDLDGISTVEKVMFWDLKLYLPDDLLVKTDRSTMAVSLEGRVPFLNKNLAEYLFSINIVKKYKNKTGKFITKKILEKYLKKEHIYKPKKGFSIPLSFWIRNPLKRWSEQIVFDERVINKGFYKKDLVKRKWDEHQRGDADNSDFIWNILMFNRWYIDVHEKDFN